MNILAGEHKSGEFPQINPQMCVPTIVDGDFMLWESKAILVYLAEKNCCPCPIRNSLYPKCPKKRALIHQRLLFDSGDFYARVCDVINLAFGPEPILTKQIVESLGKNLQVMETFLEGHQYFVGNKLTIADFPFCASVATLTNFDFDISPYPNVVEWYERMKEQKGYEQCLAGAQEMGAFVKATLKNSFADFN
jgi:glutathione S-transferase